MSEYEIGLYRIIGEMIREKRLDAGLIFCAKCILYNINFVDYFLKIVCIIA